MFMTGHPFCLLIPPRAFINSPQLQAKAKIMVVRDIEREDIEFISKTLHCLPIAHIDHMKPEKLGHVSIAQHSTQHSTQHSIAWHSGA